jgi:hypothetical protein
MDVPRRMMGRQWAMMGHRASSSNVQRPTKKKSHSGGNAMNKIMKGI